MATCKICSAIDGALPENWTNWQCSKCEADEQRTYVGYARQENFKRDLSGLIDRIIFELQVPDNLKEKAQREGHKACCENREIREAIRYCVEAEQ